ncbi:hypothetical protein CKQ90_21045, partial [Klebsiella pneumoniae]
AGKVLASDTPQALVEQRGSNSLEEAFIAWLKEASRPLQYQKNPRPTVASHSGHTAPRQAAGYVLAADGRPRAAGSGDHFYLHPLYE